MLAAVALPQAPHTPEELKTLFDANAVVIMFVYGLVHTRFPAMARVENAVIPWINAVGYVLVKLGLGLSIGTANAATIGGALSAVPDALGVLVAGALGNSLLSSLLWDKLAKPWLDGWWPKPKVR